MAESDSEMDNNINGCDCNGGDGGNSIDSADEPESKIPHHLNSVSSPSSNTPAEAAALKHKNQKLVQELDVQKKDLHDIEENIKKLKEEQNSYEDLLITVNQLWNQLVDDLTLLGVRAGGGRDTLQSLDHADYSEELGLMHYATVMYCPSMVAASAVYAANCMLNKHPLWNATLQLHTGFSETQLMQCSKFLVDIQKITGESKLKAILRKYSKSERGAVSLIQPASELSS